MDREALATKGERRRSGDCAGKVTNPYLGRSRLTPERVTLKKRSEKSAEAVVAAKWLDRDALESSPEVENQRAAKGRTAGRELRP